MQHAEKQPRPTRPRAQACRRFPAFLCSCLRFQVLRTVAYVRVHPCVNTTREHSTSLLLFTTTESPEVRGCVGAVNKGLSGVLLGAVSSHVGLKGGLSARRLILRPAFSSKREGRRTKRASFRTREALFTPQCHCTERSRKGAFAPDFRGEEGRKGKRSEVPDVRTSGLSKAKPLNSKSTSSRTSPPPLAILALLAIPVHLPVHLLVHLCACLACLCYL